MKNFKQKNSFRDLFVLDLANNHFGDVKHAKIIGEFGKVRKNLILKHALNFNLEI